jgi:ribosome-binding protein aMBF1 (putative translation factor)
MRCRVYSVDYILQQCQSRASLRLRDGVLALPDKFGVVIRRLRLEQGLSQEKLAFNSGLDRTFISMIERGVHIPSLKSLYALSGALGTSGSGLLQELEKIWPRKVKRRSL